jgi:hypothetical protein
MPLSQPVRPGRHESSAPGRPDGVVLRQVAGHGPQPSAVQNPK